MGWGRGKRNLPSKFIFGDWRDIKQLSLLDVIPYLKLCLTGLISVTTTLFENM